MNFQQAYCKIHTDSFSQETWSGRAIHLYHEDRMYETMKRKTKSRPIPREIHLFDKLYTINHTPFDGSDACDLCDFDNGSGCRFSPKSCVTIGRLAEIKNCHFKEKTNENA